MFWVINMVEMIKKVLDNDNAITVIGIVATILIAFITALLTARNTKRKTTNDFFKQEGIATQKKLLEFWSSTVMYGYEKALEVYGYKKEKNKKEVEMVNGIPRKELIIIQNVMQDSYIYSSKYTIKAMTEYQQYNFNKKEQTKEEKEAETEFSKNKKLCINLILPARVIKRMKYDFTGEKIGTTEILKLKINDLSFQRKILMRFIIFFYWLKERISNIALIILFIIISILFLVKI